MVAIAVALCLVVLLPALPAQVTSTIEGRVMDPSGAAIAGAEVRVASASLAITRQATSDSTGFYRLAGLPAGTYTITVTKPGFSTYRFNDIEVTLNRTLTLDAALKVAAVETEVSVSGVAPLLEPTTASSGATITPKQIETMPLNGRNYLDLMQLVPGVAVNKQNDSGTNAPSAVNATNGNDAVTPILGERGGNTLFLIDGMPNTNQFSGGAASQFNQESILEFQVITSGYKAEFGHASGGVINVVTKGGTNEWHGGASVFHRNYKLDSSDTSQANAPFLLRWDPSFQFGGPVKKDKIFFFGSAERIRESRELNFQWPANTPDFLIAQETPFLLHNQTYETRARAKLDEQLGNHRLSQQVNWTNAQVTDFLPLSAGNSLPSTRSNIDARTLFLGFNDTATLGQQGNPFLLNLYGQYRGEPSSTQAAHPSGGIANTISNLFNTYNDGTHPIPEDGPLFGDVPPEQVSFGYGMTPTIIKQKYTSFGASLGKHRGRHEIKFGWDFQRTVVDGQETSTLWNQLFATISDQIKYGPVDSGVYLLQGQAGHTAKDNLIAIRNNYNGLFLQDDVKLGHNLTVSGGLRWDYDARFPNNGNVSPRVGVAWAITPKTIVRGSWGQFYDHFRLGQAIDVPGFGGANLVQLTSVGFPRLFYGNPSTFVSLFGTAMGFNLPCLSNTLTDAQIAAGSYTCQVPYEYKPGSWLVIPSSKTLYGIDHLNSVVAAGHAPIPADALVTIGNIQQLSGLSPADFATQAGLAMGLTPQDAATYFGWDMFGRLAVSDAFISPYSVPVTIDPRFKTPHSNALQIGIQREIAANIVVQADYYHRDMKDILGVRMTNLAFDARLNNDRTLQPGTGGEPIMGFGPWFAGKYDALIVSVRKRMTHRFSLEASYVYANETDNVTAYTGTGTNPPSDSFVGVVPPVSEPAGTLADGSPCGGSNANGYFTACNGNPVPQAGKFYNGPDLDKGPSNLALKHTFFVTGVVQLPLKMEFSSIFRTQSGFRYSRGGGTLDVDGNANWNGIDHGSPFGTLTRNGFTAPAFANMDIRLAKHFDFTERVKLHAYFEMFNLFNTDNAAAVQALAGATFGNKLQVLPGREGQVGIRFEF